ncbi:MAG TPA: mandelate racemase/muconate lactonizing enzyme family protein [Bryobacteraceae bacterium]|nr:mandelate racemase/muconate lactonizing enzyme family protein [Bryobacteraceae bacterium]
MKIASVEAIPVRLPRDREGARRTAGSPTALQAGDGRYRWSTTVSALYSTFFETALIRITTTDGAIGWGEAQAPLAPEVACTIVDHLLKPVLLGLDVEPTLPGIADAWDRMYATMRVRGQTGGFMLDAISGVDIALWDLAGKTRGVPVSRLLSESPKASVQAYLSGVTGATLVERAQAASAKFDEGFRTFKLFHHSTTEELLETFDAIRDRLGTNASIAVDALWRLDDHTAVVLGRELDARKALWLEAPLMPEDSTAHAKLAAAIVTPLALGESYRTRFEMAPFFRARAVGFAQPDLGRTGLTEGMRIADQAAQAGAQVVPHLSIALGPQIAAAIHFAAAVPHCHILEFNPNVLAVANRYLCRPLTVTGSSYIVPEGPGLGIEMLEDDLRRDLEPSLV